MTDFDMHIRWLDWWRRGWEEEQVFKSNVNWCWHWWQLRKSGFPLLDECDKCDRCDGCWCACKMRADPLDVRDGSWVSAENLSAAFQRSLLLTAISVDMCNCTHRISGAPIWKVKERFCSVYKEISCTHCLLCLRTNNPPGSSIY